MGSNQIQDILTELVHQRDLSAEMAERAFQIIMSGGATPAQIGALLVGLRMKGETVNEITAGASVLRHKAKTFTAPPNAIDTCGTGGDGLRTFNISTATAIVAAACGVPVIKHGNRSVTSASGSSDILTALGVNVNVPAALSERALEETSLCFLMAPLYHQAMRHVAPVRKELGLRTIFNLLGPLANPARTQRQLLGVYDVQWLMPLAQVLDKLGVVRAWLVCGDDGMDELTLTGSSSVVSLDHGTIEEFRIAPEDIGLERCTPADLAGGMPQDNAKALQTMLSGAPGAYRDIVLLNCAAALLVSGQYDDLQQGRDAAAHAIDSGAARQTLAAFATITQEHSA